MTLVDLLAAISFVMPAALGATAGWKNGALIGLVVGLATGLLVGAVNFRVARIFGAWWRGRFPLEDEEVLLPLALLVLFSLGFFAWIIGSCCLEAMFLEFVAQVSAVRA